MKNAFIFTLLCFVSSMATAELNLSYQLDSGAREAIHIAAAPWERKAREQRIETSKKSEDKALKLDQEDRQKSVWPSILGCGLFGLSLIGDSSAWRGGSALLCGATVVWYHK